MPKYSTVVITYNESSNIERCLSSVHETSDEIIVVDSFSTDNTAELARRFGARVLEHRFEGYTKQKNFALSKVSNDWALCLDADEWASDEMKAFLSVFVREEARADAYVFNRRNEYLGQWFTAGGWYPDRKIRLFNRHKGIWSGTGPNKSIHESVLMEQRSKTCTTGVDIMHTPYRNLSHHYKMILSYATMIAKERSASSPKAPLFKLFISPTFRFFKLYIQKGAFLQGRRGLVFSVMAALSVFMRYALLWELNGRNGDGVK